MKVGFSVRAKRELAAIGEWIKRDNPVRAFSFVQELLDACHGLVDFPRSYPRLEGNFLRPVHKRSHEAYLILFEIRRSGIRIVAIVHSARDYTKSL